MREQKLLLLAALGLAAALLAGPGQGATRKGRAARVPPAMAAAAQAQAQGPKLDPKALEVLKRASDYIASLPAFTVHTEVAREVIFPSGVVVDADRATDVSVQRPNHLKADVRTGTRHAQVFYDGQNLTLFTPERNLYGTVPAAATLDQTIRQAEERYGLDFPAAEFLFQQPYQVMTANLQRGAYVGPSLVNGVMTDQVAFRQKDLDWQLWVAQGDRPLPVRLVIVDRAAKGAPRFRVDLSNWNTSPQFSAATFAFVPPEGAKRIAVLDLSQLRAQLSPSRVAQR